MGVTGNRDELMARVPKRIRAKLNSTELEALVAILLLAHLDGYEQALIDLKQTEESNGA